MSKKQSPSNSRVFPLSKEFFFSSKQTKLVSTRISSRSNYTVQYEDYEVSNYYKELRKSIENTISIYYSRLVFKKIDELESHFMHSFYSSPDFHYLLWTFTVNGEITYIQHTVINMIKQQTVAEYKAKIYENGGILTGTGQCEWDLTKNSTLRITEYDEYTHKRKPIVERKFGIYPANTHSFFMKTMASLTNQCSIATVKDLLQIIYIYAYA